MDDALNDLCDDLAAVMDASCTLEDPDLRLLAFSNQREVDGVRQRSILERGSTAEVREWFGRHGIADAQGPVRTPADPDRGVVSRVCVPVRHRGRLQGYFWLLDPEERIDDARWPQALPIAEAAGALLSLAERRQARRDALYREIVEGGSEAARYAVRDFASAAGLRPDEPVTCVLVERPGLTSQLSSRPSRSGSVWVREGADVCAAVVRADVVAESMRLPELLTALGLARRVPELDRATVVGIGPSVRSLDDLAEARSGALVSLRVARESGAQLRAWDTLGPLALLGFMRDTDLAATLVPERVAAFWRDGAEPLVETARVYLEEAGNVLRAASRLSVHRQTVYHRLGLVEKGTGIDLSTGAGRLTLHLALELAPYVVPGARR